MPKARSRNLLIATVVLSCLAFLGAPRAAFAQESLNFVDRENTTTAMVINESHLQAGDGLIVRLIDADTVNDTVNTSIDVQIEVLNIATLTVVDVEQVSVQILDNASLAIFPRSFVGTIQTVRREDNTPAMTTSGNGVLEVRAGDRVRLITPAGFDLPEAAGLPAIGRTMEIDEAGRAFFVENGSPRAGTIQTFTIGDNLFFRLEDDDLNTDPATQQMPTVTIITTGGDTVMLFPLPEVASDQTGAPGGPPFNTGVFTNVVGLPTAFGSPVADGILQIQPGDTITIQHSDANFPQAILGPQVAITRTFTIALTTGADGTLAVLPPTIVTPQDDLQITVTDTDTVANAIPGPGNDTVGVTVTSFDAGAGAGAIVDQEFVLVPEVSVGVAGTFTRELETEFVLRAFHAGTAASVRTNDGRLRVINGGSVRITYNDRLRLNGRTNFPVEQIRATDFNPALATVDFVQDSEGLTALVVASTDIREPGDTVFIRVVDPNGGLLGTTETVTRVTVEVVEGATVRDSENVLLRDIVPSSDGSRVYVGSIQTRYEGFSTRSNLATSNNGTLEVRGSNTIRATYTPNSGAGDVMTPVNITVNTLAQVKIAEGAGFTTTALQLDENGLLTAGNAASAGKGGAGDLEVVQAGTTITVVLFDDDLNADSTTPEAILASAVGLVLRSVGVESESAFMLQETGSNTGIFTAQIPVAFGAAAVDSGTLQVNASAGVQPTIALEYTDATPPANVAVPLLVASANVATGVDGTLGATDPDFLGVSDGTVRPGDSLVVAVTGEAADRTANLNLGPANDTVMVSVTSFSGPGGAGVVLDSETLVAPEDPAVEGTFRIRVPVTFTAAAAGISGFTGDGDLVVRSGGSVIVTYHDSLRANGANDFPAALVAIPVAFFGAAPTLSLVASADGTGAVAAIEPGDTLYVRLDDPDAQAFGITLNVTQVTVTSAAGDTERVLLRDLFPGSPQAGRSFVGEIQTKLGNQQVVANNGMLEVRGLDAPAQISVAYTSPNLMADAATAMVHQKGILRILEGAAFTDQALMNDLDFDAPAPVASGGKARAGELEVVRAGEGITIALFDDDLNTTGGVDTVNVTVRSRNGDDENNNILLRETGPNTGIFTGQVAVVFGAANDGNLQVEVDLTGGVVQPAITVEYDDQAVIGGNPDIRAFVNVASGSDGTVAIAPGTLNPGASLRITVDENPADRAVNTRPGPGNDTVSVSVTSFNNVGSVVDRETVLLSELPGTEADFAGNLDVTFTVSTSGITGPNNDGSLVVWDGGTVTVSYNDELRDSGAVNVPVVGVPAVVNVALVGAPPTVMFVTSQFGTGDQQIIEPGDTVFVRVDDPNAPVFGITDGITVTVTSLAGDSEIVQLRRLNPSNPADDTFTGWIDSKFGDQQVIQNNGQLEVRGRDAPQVTVTYNSLLGPVTDTLQVHVNGTIRVVADPTGMGLDVERVTVGDRIWVQLTDDDLNTDPNVVETFNVTIRTFNNVPDVDSAAGVMGAGSTVVDQELGTIQLRETGPDTGIFINRSGTPLGNGIPIAFSAGAGINGNQIIEINGNRSNGLGGALVVDYGDAATPAGGSGSNRFDFALLNVGEVATIATFPAEGGILNPSQNVSISITDNVTRTREYNAGVLNDSIVVSITAYTGTGLRLDVETLVVGENDVTQLNFLRELPTEFVDAAFPRETNNQDGRLQVQAGGTIQFVFYDPLDPVGQIFTSTPRDAAGNLVADLVSQVNVALANVAPTLRFVASESELAPDVGRIDAGDEVHILLTDANFDVSPDRDVVTVNVTTNYGDQESIQLVETRPRSGIFTGSASTVFALDRRIDDATALDAVRGNGVLEVRGGSVAVATFTQAGGFTNPATNPGLLVEIRDPGAMGNTTSDTLLVHVPARTRIESNDSGQGSKVVEIKAREDVFMTVTDDDANVNPAALDAVTVTLTSFTGAVLPASPISAAAAGVIDQEVIMLTETGFNTGVFTRGGGTGITGFPTRFALAGTAGDAVLQVAAPDGTPQNNRIVLEYRDGDFPDATPTLDPTINFVRDTARIRKGVDTIPVLSDSVTAGIADRRNGVPANPLTTLIGGHDILVAVTGELDASFNMGTANDSLTVSVTSFRADGLTIIDTEFVTLAETLIEGAFQGRVRSAYVDPLQIAVMDNGVVEVVPGGQVNATYVDPLRLDGEVDRSVTGNVTLTVPAAVAGVVEVVNSASATANVVRRIEPGDTLWIRVTDRDLDIVPNGSSNTITVSVTTSSANDTALFDTDAETVILHATATDPHVFIGSIQTRLASTIGFDVAPFPAQDPAGTQIRAQRQDGTLQVRGRHVATVTYFDQNPSGQQSTTVPIEVVGQLRAQENLSQDAGEIQTFRVGTAIAIRVADDDLNTQPTVSDTVLVTLTVNTNCAVPGNGAGDREEVLLTEVGTDSGIFTALVPTRSKPTATDNDGFLDLPDTINTRICTGAVTVLYQDEQLPVDPLDVVVVETNTRVLLDAQFGPDLAPTTARVEILIPRAGVYTRPNELDRLIGGSRMFIRVTDPDADVTPLTDAITVTIRVTTSAVGAPVNPANQIVPGSPEIVDIDVMQIGETGPSTGVWERQVPTNFGPAVASDGIVSVSGETHVELEYMDMLDSLGRMSTLFARVDVAPDYLDEAVATLVRQQGTVLDLSNGARLSIPANAIVRAAEVNFRLKYARPAAEGGDPRPSDEAGNPIPAPLDPSIQILRDRDKAFWYELQPSEISFKRQATLLIPVPLTAHVPAGNAPLSAIQRAQLRVVFFDGFEWIPVGGTFLAANPANAVPDPAQDYVQASINHFTTYALAVDARTPPEPSGPLVSGVEATNNPFTPNGDGINDTTTVKFGLAETSEVTIKIFDTTGEVVRTLVEGVVLPAGFVSESWDGTYRFGDRVVPSGLYVVEISARGLVTGRRARETFLLGVIK